MPGLEDLLNSAAMQSELLKALADEATFGTDAYPIHTYDDDDMPVWLEDVVAPAHWRPKYTDEDMSKALDKIEAQLGKAALDDKPGDMVNTLIDVAKRAVDLATKKQRMKAAKAEALALAADVAKSKYIAFIDLSQENLCLSAELLSRRHILVHGRTNTPLSLCSLRGSKAGLAHQRYYKLMRSRQ